MLKLIWVMFLVLLLLEQPEKVKEYALYFKSTFISKVVDTLGVFLKKKVFDIRGFVQNLPDELKDKFNDIYLINSSEFDNLTSLEVKKEIELLRKTLELITISEKQNEIIERIKKSEKNKDKDDVKKYQKQLNDLVKTKLRLEGKAS